MAATYKVTLMGFNKRPVTRKASDNDYSLDSAEENGLKLTYWAKKIVSGTVDLERAIFLR